MDTKGIIIIALAAPTAWKTTATTPFDDKLWPTIPPPELPKKVKAYHLANPMTEVTLLVPLYLKSVPNRRALVRDAQGVAPTIAFLESPSCLAAVGTLTSLTANVVADPQNFFAQRKLHSFLTYDFKLKDENDFRASGDHWAAFPKPTLRFVTSRPALPAPSDATFYLPALDMQKVNAVLASSGVRGQWTYKLTVAKTRGFRPIPAAVPASVPTSVPRFVPASTQAISSTLQVANEEEDSGVGHDSGDEDNEDYEETEETQLMTTAHDQAKFHFNRSAVVHYPRASTTVSPLSYRQYLSDRPTGHANVAAPSSC